MSSLLIFHKSDAVHILMDGASYDEAGVLRQVGSKVSDLPLANCVLAMRGAGWARDALTSLLGLLPSLDDICDVLPDVIGGLLNIWDRQNADDDDRRHRNFEVTVAGWSDRAQGWAACLASTFAANDPNDPIGWSSLEGYEPGFAFFTTPLVAHPPVDVESVLGRAVETPADVQALEIKRDGLALHRAQRMEPGVFLGEPQYLVGGFAELVTVSAGGIERQIIQEWPDVVGEMIAPEGAPTLQHWRDRIEEHLAA
jgi:hypothetical protein